MPSPTVEEVYEAKSKLEQDIRDLVESFESETGLVVRGVSVARMDVLSAAGAASVIDEVTADVRLLG